jgi:hypothetical protein
MTTREVRRARGARGSPGCQAHWPILATPQAARVAASGGITTRGSARSRATVARLSISASAFDYGLTVPRRTIPARGASGPS